MRCVVCAYIYIYTAACVCVCVCICTPTSCTHQCCVVHTTHMQCDTESYYASVPARPIIFALHTTTYTHYTRARAHARGVFVERERERETRPTLQFRIMNYIRSIIYIPHSVLYFFLSPKFHKKYSTRIYLNDKSRRSLVFEHFFSPPPGSTHPPPPSHPHARNASTAQRSPLPPPDRAPRSIKQGTTMRTALGAFALVGA